MNALEIIGKAAVSSTFRQELFGNVESVISQNQTDLPRIEQEALRRLVQPNCPPRQGARAATETNTLSDALDAVGKAISRMCPKSL
jgi:hypothetical protein